MRIVVWSLAALLFVATWFGWKAVMRQQHLAEVAPALEHLIMRGTRSRVAGTLDPIRLRRALDRFYGERRYRPAWSDGERPTADARELLRRLANAASDGLDSTVFPLHGLRVMYQIADTTRTERTLGRQALARLDFALSVAFMRYARDVHDGRFPDSTLDRDWVIARDTLDLAAALARAVGEHAVDRTLDAAAPQDDGYRRLRDALARYRAVADAGGWPALGDGPPLERGARDERVATLRRRLAIEGDLESAGTDSLFDRRVVAAVDSFQARNGIPVTGRVGPETRAALDITAAQRVRQIGMNLERRRWLPRPLPEPYLIVNIPQFRLALSDSGRTTLEMRVVVGAKNNPTPVFSDRVTYLEMNPVWRLPRRILVDEVLPLWKRNHDYFMEHHMRVLYTGGTTPVEVRADSIDWTKAEDDTFPFVVAQDAGGENPLGHIKFMCPNEYDVYLHDTSMPRAFELRARDMSHGCVRVEQPFVLAERLLRDSPLGVPDSITAILESGIFRHVGLKTKMPVHMLYWTAWVNERGVPQFRNDLYEIDRRMSEALQSGRVTDFVLNPEVQWGAKHRAEPAPKPAKH